VDYIQRPSQNKKTLKRISKLTIDTLRSSYHGIGKPEPLKKNLATVWARKVDESNLLIYTVDKAGLTVISCRYHYEEQVIN
jgi:toxin YoeB